MGQTLSHGVYLPNEGERNCYAGLASNWQILNTAVGAIAEKAPLVHTHTVSQITDFPAYGTTAGTICEGNDSRLSDARTPVAHTHTKSDVTDLFNSANTWSAEQTITNNFYSVKETNYELGQSYPNGNHLSGLQIKDKNGSIVGLFDIVDRSYGSTEMRITVQQKFDPDSNNRSTSGTVIFSELTIGIAANKTKFINLNADLRGANCNLGTATAKWKTLNGINPGALSLPGEYSSSVTEYVTDKTGGNNVYTAPADGWVGIQANSATLDSDNFIFMGRTSDGLPYYEQNASSPITAYWSNLYHGCILLPVIGGKTYGIRCKCDTVDARFYKANGNVS